MAAGDAPGVQDAATKVACPARLDGFVNGAATAAVIVGCIGKPASADHNPDGRFVYLYKLRDGITVAYLFDAGGVLASTNVYQATVPPKAP